MRKTVGREKRLGNWKYYVLFDGGGHWLCADELENAIHLSKQPPFDNEDSEGEE